jgi:hypothetical protein
MAKRQALRDPAPDIGSTINIGDRAIDNLRFIRETMERSTSFTAVPGYGGMLMGATAVAAAYIANNYAPLRQDWLITWLVEAIVAFAIGLASMWHKSLRGDVSLLSAPARKFASGFVPPVIVGVAMTVGLWRLGHFEAMIPAWILCYGAAVVCGGAFSVRIVPVMGWCFIAIGAVAYTLPAGWGNTYMALSFGLTHIIFGAVIARRYGG